MEEPQQQDQPEDSTHLSATSSRPSQARSYDRPPYEAYAIRLFSFALGRPLITLYSGDHYRAIAQFLTHKIKSPPPAPLDGPLSSINQDHNEIGGFVYVHTHTSNNDRTSKRKVRNPTSFDALDKILKERGNCLLFLRGYASAHLLCQLGERLDLDYEFLCQHYSHALQQSVADNYCLPSLSMHSTGILQLTFTSIGLWDNYHTGVDLETARASLAKDMKECVEDFNKGQRFNLCDSVVRSFRLHDLKHFSLEQMITINLLERDGKWTVVIWSDFGSSLSQSHRGPWVRIEQEHSSSTRFLPVPLHYTNAEIKKILRSAIGQVDERDSSNGVENVKPRLVQSLCSLHTDLGLVANAQLANEDPFYAISGIFRFYAASENQFFNLMRQKIQEKGQSPDNIRNSIAELQAIKRLVTQHISRLNEVISFIYSRGGEQWNLSSAAANAAGAPRAASYSNREPQRTHNAAKQPEMTFRKLLGEATALSDACTDEMTMLGNAAMVHEAQKSIQLAEAIGKVTFIAFVFVPLSFTTSFFGMNVHEISGTGQRLWIWFAVSAPVMLLSLLAWWVNAERRRRMRRFWAPWMRISGDRNAVVG